MANQQQQQQQQQQHVNSNGGKLFLSHQLFVTVLAFLGIMCLWTNMVILNELGSGHNVVVDHPTVSRLPDDVLVEKENDYRNNYNNGVVHSFELTNENFNDWLEDHPLAFVNFFAPWCIWCQRLVPTWEKFAEEIKNRNMPVGVGTGDCTAQVTMCRNAKVNAFPLLRWYEFGKHTIPTYSGDRSVKNLVSFVEQRLENPSLPKPLLARPRKQITPFDQVEREHPDMNPEHIWTAWKQRVVDDWARYDAEMAAYTLQHKHQQTPEELTKKREWLYAWEQSGKFGLHWSLGKDHIDTYYGADFRKDQEAILTLHYFSSECKELCDTFETVWKRLAEWILEVDLPVGLRSIDCSKEECKSLEGKEKEITLLFSPFKPIPCPRNSNDKLTFDPSKAEEEYPLTRLLEFIVDQLRLPWVDGGYFDEAIEFEKTIGKPLSPISDEESNMLVLEPTQYIK